VISSPSLTGTTIKHVEVLRLQPLAGAGFISLHGGTLCVTRKGRYVANEVCVRLFRDYFSGG
jgi:hypothetical protein